MNNLSNEYGVGRAMIHEVRKNSDKPFFCKNNDNVKNIRKTVRMDKFPQVEDTINNFRRN